MQSPRIFRIAFALRASFPLACCGLLILLNTGTAVTVAQAPPGSATADYQMAAKQVQTAPPDPAIAEALAEVSEAHIRQTIEKLVGFGNRSTLSSMEVNLPAGTGVTAAADWIYAQFEAMSKECGGCLEIKRDTFTEPVADRIPQPTTITNVYAILRGNDSVAAQRMYLVTGHYDSRNSDTMNTRAAAPGANDDASGVAVSLECARVLSKMASKLNLRGTVVFAAVAGEEQGLNGSAHLAHLARTEGRQLEAVLNNDIVGGNTTPGDTLQLKDRVRVFSEGIPAGASADQARRIRAMGLADDAPSRQVARAVADAARTYLSSARFMPFLVSRPDRYLRGGDHTSFNREGFAGVRLTEWREDFNHQHQDVRIEDGVQFGDLLQFVDFGYVAQVARLNAATLATLAASPGTPADVTIVTDKLENGTTLRWQAPKGEAAGASASTHYEVLWRETTAADWQYAFEVKETAVTLPVSKDNVFFGVRAVDAAGHRGLVAVP